MSTYVAVDIGGTHIRAAAFETDNTTPLTHERTRSYGKKPGTFDRLVEAIEKAWPEGRDVKAISMASPGPLDPNTGVVLATPNIPEWVNFPLTDKLTERFDVPAYLDNDANLAALGEWKFGAGRDHRDVLYLTISTGIGGGVVINDRLIRGYHGLAAELGHVTVLADGPVCSCGIKGHLEALAAGPAIVRYVNEQLEAGSKSELSSDEDLTAYSIAEAARRGDELAKSAYERAGRYLGIGVASFLHTFDPSIVIFGGGVSQSGPLLFEPFEASLHDHVLLPRYLEDLVITTTALGYNVGLLGALALAQMEQSEQ
jgi:glucokinase